jgi:hypothetical protein
MSRKVDAWALVVCASSDITCVGHLSEQLLLLGQHVVPSGLLFLRRHRHRQLAGQQLEQ